MARSKPSSSEGDGKSDEGSARLAALLKEVEADLKKLLQHWLPLLEELGYFNDFDAGGLKVLLQLEATPLFVCIVSLCSKEPLERLSPREREILPLLRKGLSTKEIAAKLGIKPRTVETYITRASAKLGVHSRVLLALRARVLG